MLEMLFHKKDGFYTTNFILAADSYKVGQEAQYPDGDTAGHSNLVPRKSYTTEGGTLIDHVVCFGSGVVSAILSNVVITDEMIDEAEVEINQQGYHFPRKNWERIRDYGFLPLSVRAIPDGTVVPVGLPIMTIENTDEHSRWLVSYVETWIQDISWESTTVASKLRVLRKQCQSFARVTGVPDDGPEVEFMIHNFGDRGAGDGGQGGIIPAMAHALFFSGSDCMRLNRHIKKAYNTDKPYTSSIDASEHSTMCSNSDLDAKNDYGAFEMGMKMLNRARLRAEEGIGIPVIANVIDTYDDERFVEWTIAEYDRICSTGAKYVLRPDSGNAVTKPIQIVKQLLAGLPKQEKTSLGYDNLPGNIGVIQGDGLREGDFARIMNLAIKEGISASCLAFGYGGGLTNGSGRDDFSFSMKATSRKNKDGKWVDMQKAPKSDIAKTSLLGRVTTFKTTEGRLIADRVSIQDINKTLVDVMIDVYKDGKCYYQNFDEVRALART